MAAVWDAHRLLVYFPVFLVGERGKIMSTEQPQTINNNAHSAQKSNYLDGCRVANGRLHTCPRTAQIPSCTHPQLLSAVTPQAPVSAVRVGGGHVVHPVQFFQRLFVVFSSGAYHQGDYLIVETQQQHSVQSCRSYPNRKTRCTNSVGNSVPLQHTRHSHTRSYIDRSLYTRFTHKHSCAWVCISILSRNAVLSVDRPARAARPGIHW